MKYQTLCSFILSIACVSQAAAAASTMRPGLWEHTSNIKTQSGEMEKSMQQMQQQMASMPSEQRKMMENMMASQGVSVSPKGNSVKVCVTKQEAELSPIPQSDPQCKHQIIRRTASTVVFTFNCTGQNPSSGEGEYVFQNNKAYKGKMTVRTKTQGRSEVMQMDQSGKWLSDSCGNIKPLPR